MNKVLKTKEDLNNLRPGEYVLEGEAAAEIARQLAKQIEIKSFSNSSIVEPRPGKPHIKLIGGYWRVSAWKRGTGNLYYKAHYFVRRLNLY